MAMHIELQATCSALGYHEGSQYVKEPDCLETVKELIRFLRREDETCDIRRQLGHAQILQKDLLPLVKQHHKDKPLFDTVIRLLVNLTQPVLVCFNNHLPEEKTLRQHCLEIESHLQQYKEAFVDEELFTVLTKKMSELLELDWEHRREEDKLMLERLLVLVRNVLHIPPDPATEQRTDDDASLHDQILWSIHVSGMEDLLLYIASSENERQLCMHILEIVSLMFREQSPEVLAFAGVQRSMTEKEKDERELELARAKEKAQKRNTMLRFNTRHSNFGGTYVMMNTQSLSDKELIYHKPIQEADNFTLDTSKKPRKKPKNRQPIKDVPVIRRSTLSIRLGLKEFCVQLLENAYNRLMYAVKDNLIREATQDLDETYYMWSMKFFMEFCRHHSGHVDFISETLSVQSFHYIYNNLLRYYETITLEKKEAVTWGKRVHLALRAYQELLMTIDMMDKSRNSHLRDSAQVIKSNVFYVMEFRDIFITLLKRFNESRNSRAYLKDLVESTHLFLKMLEKHSKSSNHLVVQGKKRKRKKKTKKVTTKKCEEPSEQELEDLWQELSSELSALLQGRIEVPDDVTPFDATSEVDVDQQRVDAMVRIHQSLRQKKAGEAVALFRAAREVWPEQNEFGSQDITAEEEFMALREIFIAPLPGGSNLEEMQPEEMAEEEIEEEEEVTVAAQASWEQEFNFTAFLMNFAKPEILRSYVLLIADFENNSAHTNHCTVKMLHRIAFDLGFVGMMFQASLFRVFQKLMTGITVAVARFRELYTFGIHVVRKFSEVAEKNKKVFMEMLFWKGSKEAMQITQGYDYVPDTGKVAWTEAEENELIRLFEDFRDVQNPEKDAVDLIMEQWSGTNKTRGQFIRQLKKLQLIESARDLNKKSGPSRAWTADDEQELQQVYQEYKDTDDPLSGIVLALTKKRSKNKVMEKLLALGVVNDRKKLYKRRHRKNDGKKPRRGRHTGSDDDASSHDEGEEGQNVLSEDLDLLDANGDGLPSDEEILSSPSVSGSSSDADDTSDDDSAEILSGENESHQNVDNRSTSSIDLGEMICNIVDKGYKDQVCWIQKLLNQNANVREGQDKLFSVSIVPLTEENETAMEDSLFTNFLQQLGLSPPANEQEVFWRIPSHLKSSDLRAIATGIELNEAGQVLNPEALGQIHFWKPKPSARVKERKRPKPSARVKERKRKPDDKARLAKQERQRKEKRKAEKDKGKERKKRKTDQSSKQHNQDFSPDTIAVEDNVDDSDDQKGSKMSSALQRREALRAMLERRTEKNVSRKKKFPEKVSNEQADCIAETTSAEIEERVISPSPNMDVGQSEVISEKSKKRVKRVMDSNSDSEDRLNKASSHASLPKSTRQVMLSDSAISDNDEDENAAASQSQSQSQGPLDFGDSDDNEDCMPEKVHDASSDDNIPLTGVAQGKEDSFPVTSPYRPPDSEDSDRDCHVPLNALKNRDKFISDDEDD